MRFPALSGSEPVLPPTALTYPHNPRPPPAIPAGYNTWVPVRQKQPQYQVCDLGQIYEVCSKSKETLYFYEKLFIYSSIFMLSPSK